ncbi:hypothetical protein [Empedobacter brevis]|uniref:hypothetical protein n=1 Tax=Empedobacter brevis TaxID=247 RepID=UPI0039AFA8D9
MKKIVLFFFCIYSYAQVGINTEYPTGIFMVDGKADNKSLTPSINEISNDVKILENANLGIGVENPSVSIDIKSNINAGFSLKDGTEGQYYRLVSDQNGDAKWKKRNSVIVSQIEGSYSGLIFTTTLNYTGRYIILGPGEWIVRSNLLLRAFNAASPSSGVYAKFSWAENTNGTYLLSQDVLFGKIFGGNYSLDYGIAKGSTIIKNASSEAKKYYLVTNEAEKIGDFPTNSMWDKLGGTWGETSIIAFPFD